MITDFLIGCLHDDCDLPAMPDGKVWEGTDFFNHTKVSLIHYTCPVGHSYHVPKEQLLKALHDAEH